MQTIRIVIIEREKKIILRFSVEIFSPIVYYYPNF